MNLSPQHMPLSLRRMPSPCRYAASVAVLVGIGMSWWVYGLKPLMVANHDKVSDLELKVSELAARAQQPVPAQDFSLASWLMLQATEAGLSIEQCSDRQNHVMITVRGDFAATLRYITLIDQTPYPLALETCSIAKHPDTLLASTLRVAHLTN